eukprot:scaffold1708_cov322-Pavlova_lutheri.AAC.16
MSQPAGGSSLVRSLQAFPPRVSSNTRRFADVTCRKSSASRRTFPPGRVAYPRASTVSPGSGRRMISQYTSALADPATTSVRDEASWTCASAIDSTLLAPFRRRCTPFFAFGRQSASF